MTGALCGVLCITGCGVKSPIIPPDTDFPKAVSHFEAFVRGEELLFTWDAPKKEKRAEFIGYKLFYEDEDETKNCWFRCRKFRELAFLDLESGDADWIKNGRIELRLPVTPSLFWKTYRYVVVPISRKGHAGDESREITIHWTPPPSPPEVLQARPGDRSVRLEWETTEGLAPLQFNIYRRTGEEAYPLVPVNHLPVSENRYLDKGVQNWTRYYYLVRSMDSDIRPWIESRASSEVEVTPVDRVSPAPPIGLEAIPGQTLVRLFWEENKEGDLLGYRIYRRSKNRGGFVKIGDVRQPTTIFTDEDVQVGTVYEYYVAAYDNASAQNESGPSKTVKVRP